MRVGGFVGTGVGGFDGTGVGFGVGRFVDTGGGGGGGDPVSHAPKVPDALDPKVPPVSTSVAPYSTLYEPLP
jgi:hypothetical protein